MPCLCWHYILKRNSQEKPKQPILFLLVILVCWLSSNALIIRFGIITCYGVDALPLLIFFFSFSQQIATQIAVLIAKVARLDCPRQWPELIPILLESVKGQDGLLQHRALLTFYHVTKTLASKRLAQDRRLFQDVSPY